MGRVSEGSGLLALDIMIDESDSLVEMCLYTCTISFAQIMPSHKWIGNRKYLALDTRRTGRFNLPRTPTAHPTR